MSHENPWGGAPRIHGELLMLGTEVAQSTVAKYLDGRGRPSSQGWKTFLRNHAAGIASIDLFVVRSISFKLFYVLVILGHLRRRLVRISVTTNPTAEWIAGQVTEAFPWDQVPRHLIRDRDGSFGPAYARRVRAMGIRDRPTAPRSPWQNGSCRATDRLNSSGMPRSHGGVRRSRLASPLEELRLLLQSGPHPFIVEQERSAFPTPANSW